ncbi:MAG TPA: response regulator transcription factor [Gemmataceae bacterium]|nr:response regulator transcription factor [Gemmataceae bacterium]
MDRPRVLLADDHGDFLALEARLLEPDYEVVTTVGDGRALLEQAARLKPDVVVLDISMPVMNGIVAAQHLYASGCAAKVIFMTVHSDPEYAREALLTGAAGYVVKCRLVSDLPEALKEALAGRRFVSPSISLE